LKRISINFSIIQYQRAFQKILPTIFDHYTKKYIVTEFPHKGNMSIIVSIMKVYPALNKYMEENGYEQNVPVMEIYDMPNKKILYRAEAIKISK